MLKTRVKTAAALTVIVLVVLYFSYISYVMESAAAALGMAGSYELYGACGRSRKSVWFAVSLLLAAVFPFLPLPRYAGALTAVLPLTILLFGAEAMDLSRFTLFGNYSAFVYSLMIAVLFRSFSELCGDSLGRYHFLLAIIICVVTDTGAYFIGRAAGGHRLAPHISPHKSVEGAVGGMALAVVLPVLLCRAAAAFGFVSVNYGRATLFALSVSIIGQLGDLSLSVIKRIAGVKDYGKLLPGHGGILDRFDSLLLAAPWTLIFMENWPVLRG